MLFSVAQDDHPYYLPSVKNTGTFSISSEMTIDGLFLPKDGNNSALASCTTFLSVYVSLSKNSFFCASEVVSSLADAKVDTFF